MIRRRAPALALSLGLTACAHAGPAPASQAAPPAPVVRRVDTVRVVDTLVPRPMVPDTALAAGRFDNGKMWTFEYPPLDYFRESYGFAPDSAWFRRARLGALRLPNCTASFVSATGLVLTNHHCAREGAVATARPGETPLDSGFYATRLQDERQVPDLYVDQLIAIEDLTARLDTVADDARDAAAEAADSEIAARYGGDSAGIVVETVKLWNGARTSAYVFRRFDDVRLVMVPEGQVAFFGGDPDNFTYPRYDLDMAFLRVYQHGEPYHPDVFFRVSTAGVGDGDPVFIVGNPGSTSRLQTVPELEFRRDVSDRALLGFLRHRIAALEAFATAAPAAAESVDVRNKIFSLANSAKAYGGILGGLADPVVMARRADNDRRMREAIAGDSALRRRFGGLFGRMAEIQQAKRAYAPQVSAFAAFGSPDWTAAAVLRGLFAFQYVSAKRGGAPAATLAQIKDGIAAVGQQPPAMQEGLLAARLSELAAYLGDTSAVVRRALGGQTPAARAHAVISQTALVDSAAAAGALDGLTDGDPALALAAVLLPAYFGFQQRYSALTQDEAEVALQLGRARFAVYGTREPPDATFSLRIADGVVRGYPYNGTEAPTHTTFHGMLDRYHSFGAGGAWDLPPRWRKLPAAFALSTPLDFISTADIIGGNSGSPVLNRNLEVVGLVFDGNIESLPGDFIYLPEKNRTVAVDARGIVEALRNAYGATRLVTELVGAPASRRR